MKMTDKVITKYKEEDSDKLFEAIRNADEDDLRVLLAAILLDGGEGVSETSKICEALGIDETAFGASLKFWRGAGIMSAKRSATSKKETTRKTENSKHLCAHKDGKLENTEIPTYTTEELADLMKKRKITSEFIGEASRIYGKIFNQHEVGIIVRMIDYIGFDEECVLLLLSHYAKGEPKRPIRYIEKAALAFYDEGISDAATLGARLTAIESAKQIEGQIKAMFGMSGRSLTTKEKKYISAWTEKMGFGIEMIRLAYDITVDKTHEPAPAYANAILERWYANGVDTPEKVAQLEEKKAEKKATEVGRSFEEDDFFEAALKRTYGNK